MSSMDAERHNCKPHGSDPDGINKYEDEAEGRELRGNLLNLFHLASSKAWKSNRFFPDILWDVAFEVPDVSEL